MTRRNVARARWVVTFGGVASLVLVACGGSSSSSLGPSDSGSDGNGASPDATPQSDSAMPGDATSNSDGGNSGDAAIPTDSGTKDTGTTADSGGMVPDTGGGPGVCGNGVRESGEQCDDGNLIDLDGCDSTCHFEQVTRATDVTMVFTTDSFCAHDALCEAVGPSNFGAQVRSQFQSTISGEIQAGTINVVFKYFGITDPTGQSGSASVGSYAAAPPTYTGGTTGTSDLDWWYTVVPATAGTSPLYLPTAAQSPGTFAGGLLAASGGHVELPIFGSATLDMAEAQIQLPVGAASKPKASSGAAPGHLASENLDPSLTSFATAGGTNAAPTGKLCGNVTALSMSTPGSVPPSAQTGGANACTENYDATNSALDWFVTGCHVMQSIFTVEAIAPTNPDTVDTGATPAGAGGPYTFTADATHHVNACKDKNGTAVTPYTDCLAPAAYSTYLQIAVDRVILKHP
jgi:cysteine-rich repeat protein